VLFLKTEQTRPVNDDPPILFKEPCAVEFLLRVKFLYLQHQEERRENISIKIITFSLECQKILDLGCGTGLELDIGKKIRI